MRKLSLILAIMIIFASLGCVFPGVAFAAPNLPGPPNVGIPDATIPDEDNDTSDDVFEKTASAFDDAYVLNDLEGATIDGKLFYVGDYPQDKNRDLRLLAFSEYAYSEDAELRGNYGLYLYVYNPQAIDFTDDELNVIQLATGYGYDSDGQFAPTVYDKQRHVTICNRSEDKLFYKLKVDKVSDIYARVARTEARRYDISSLELKSPEKVNADDYKVGGTWIYSGFAKGCDESSKEESTLSWQITELKTVDITDLQFTVYRAWNDTSGEDNEFTQVADQLTSVYFAVPTSISNKYDYLYSIQAQTYKYLTAPVFNIYSAGNLIFMNYSDFYDDLVSQKGLIYPKATNNSLDRVLYWDCTQLTDGSGGILGWWNNGSFLYRRGYNLEFKGSHSSPNILPMLSWLNKLQSQSYISKHPEEISAASVSSSELLKYMLNYVSRQSSEKINGKYSTDLFSDKYWVECLSDVEVKNGYLYIDINVSGEDDFTLVGSSSKQIFWDSIFHGTLGSKWDGSQTSEPICPIIEVTMEDLSGKTTAQISKEFYITEGDVPDFVDYVSKHYYETVYLFRFDVSTYVSSKLYNNFSFADNWNCDIGYMFQEATFLDFDIISMGYSKDGVVTILPVVSNPIDIVPDGEKGSVDVSSTDAVLNRLEALLDKIEAFFAKIVTWLKEYWWVIVLGIVGIGLLIGAVVLAVKFGVKSFFRGVWWLLKWILICLWYAISALPRLIVLIANKIKENRK